MCLKSSSGYQYCLLKRRVAVNLSDWVGSVAYLIAQHHGWLEEIELQVDSEGVAMTLTGAVV